MKSVETKKESLMKLKRLYYFLDRSFIPKNIVIMRNKETNQICPTIDLQSIIDLKFNKKQNRKVINYLNDQGIVVYGCSEDMDSKLEVYDHFISYRKAVLPTLLTEDEMMDKFKIYTLTKDPVIREQLILQNLNQVPYIAWKYATKYDFSFEQLESFGYEGLIMAVDKFDVTKDVQFSTYARETIIGYIKIGLIGSVGIYKRNDISTELAMCKNIIETKNECKLEEQPEEMKQEIIDLMISKYNYPNNEQKRRELENLINIYCFPEPFENSTRFSTFEDSTPNELIDEQLKADLNEILMAMPNSKKRKIIQLRYGLDGQEPKTFTEIGKILGIELSDVKVNFLTGLRQLKYPAKRKGMKDYLESYEMNPDSEYNVKKGR